MQTLKYKFGRGSRLNTPSSSPAIRESDEVFTFSRAARPTNTVHVENVPSHVKNLEIVSLFHTLIGDVRSFQEVKDTSNTRLEITFADCDSATKALCMNGYTVGGVPLKVAAPVLISSSPRYNKLDDRRNLYVLGLPFALTKSEFAGLFAQYGAVSHCVILATVDNSSRRRGFIVMSTHEEAKNAMSALTRTQIKGHTIDVSWAVVQRSQGFLDGGDRAMILESRVHISHPISPLLPDRSGLSSDTPVSPVCSKEIDPTLLTISFMPTISLLVSNLPTLLFSQVQDLRPLFFPFGQIDKLEIVHISPLGSMSVIVQYSTTTSAQEAKESLNGQLYGNFRIEARYVCSWGVPNSISKTLAKDQLLSIERRMTDPLPRSVDHILRSRCAGQVNTPAPKPTKDLAIVSTSPGPHDFFSESTHTALVPRPSLQDTPNDLDEHNLAFSSYGSLGMLQNYTNIDWTHFRSDLRSGRPILHKSFANSETSKLDTLYWSSAA